MGPRRVHGRPRPFRLPALRLAPWFGYLAGLGALPPCGGGNFEACGHDPAKCRAERRELGGVAWPTCPVRLAIEDQGVAYIRRLHRDMRLSPATLGGRRFAAWVLPALDVYTQAYDAAQAKAEEG